MNFLITICARGGSKGIPGKNIKILNGKPLISYSINTAKKFADLIEGDIELSTDSIDIRNTAAEFDLETSYLRPLEFATDTAGKIAVIDHLLRYKENLEGKKYDFILDLDVTSPMRTVEDLEDAYKQILEDENALNIFSVSPPNRNPYFNMVEANNDGYFKLVKEGKTIKSRQSAPIVYDMNASFYIYRRRFFDEGWEIALTNKSLAYLVPHYCFDLDEPIDFTIMELMLREDLLDFEL